MAMASILSAGRPRSGSRSGPQAPLPSYKTPVAGKFAKIKALGDGILDYRPQPGGLLPTPVKHRMYRSFSYNLVTGSTDQCSAIVKPSPPALISSSPQSMGPRLPSDFQTDGITAVGLLLDARATPEPVKAKGLIAYTGKNASAPPPKSLDIKVFVKKQAGVPGRNQIGDTKKKTCIDTSGILSSAKNIRRKVQNIQDTKAAVPIRKGDSNKVNPVSGAERQGEMQGSLITILQRPNDSETAKELFARFFKKAEGSSGEESDVENVDVGASDRNADIFPIELEKTPSLGGAANSQELLITRSRMFHGLKRSFIKRRNSAPSQDANVEKLVNSRCFFSADVERWAGPAYCNSPPPSSLPLPSFSLKQLRTSLDLSDLSADRARASLHQRSYASSCPSSTSPPSSLSESPPAYIWDTASATKDLRRMLNLDVCSI